MTVEYTKRAVSDLDSITAYYESVGASGIGDLIATRIEEIAARIAAWPESGKLVSPESGLRT